MWRIWPIAAFVLGVLVLGVATLLLQDSIARALIAPKTPFQIAPKPAAPNYEDPSLSAWILWPTDAEGAAEIFYIHSTTYYAPTSWNGSAGDVESDEVLKRLAVPNEAGPFLEVGRLFGPRYRQATLFAAFTHKFDGIAARLLAYGDIKRAFRRFLAASDPKKPIVLVGYEQGGLHALGLVQDFFQSDEALRKRLAAAYILGQATPKTLFETTLSKTPACDGPESIRCIVAYVDLERRFAREAERMRDRSVAWRGEDKLGGTRGEPILCVNPLTWTETAVYVGKERHIGAASATGVAFGQTPPKVAAAFGAQCADGILKVDRPQQDYLRRSDWMGSKWRAQHFNLFYFDLAADARRRVAAATQKMEVERQTLEPIAQSVDILDSPIKKVPR
jgi:hypothetical protein